MGLRTFVQLTAEVYRQVNSPIQRASVFDIQQALNDAYREITQYADWNYLLDRYDIPLVASYSAGTVTATQGSTAITGAGTTWVNTWYNRKIMLSGDSEEKEIINFTGAGSAVLRYPYNSTLTPTTNLSYTIYQDSYPVPISPGRDLMIVNPQFQWSRLKKYDKWTFMDRTAFNRFSTDIRPTIYTDDGTDTVAASPTFGQPKLQFWPRPTAAQDLVLAFFRAATPLAADGDRTILPPEFEEILIKIARFRIKKSHGIPGWMDDEREAFGLLVQMRDKQASSTAYDFEIKSSLFPSTDTYAMDAAFGSWPGRLG